MPTAIIIPSLNPDDGLTRLVSLLRAECDLPIIVIDDGSDEEHRANFPQADEISDLTLLRHPVNRGKGAAMKTAFAHILECRPEITGVITADGDGQHLPRDIIACIERMESERKVTLGVRDFNAPGIPPRSRGGNKFTSLVFRLFCGIKLSDTQTGLRAFPREVLPHLISVSGDRYEYETNQLLELKRLGIPFIEVSIETVYVDDNRASHFRAVRDSLRIYSFILKFLASSLASCIVDLAAFFIFTLLFGGILGKLAELVCTALARVISSLFNFAVNKKLVFEGGDRGSIVRYYILAVGIMLASGGILTLFDRLLGVGVEKNEAAVTLVKLVVDTLLFLVSYRVQRMWVFAPKKNKNNEERQ